MDDRIRLTLETEASIKVELQDPLGGLDLSPEGWLKDLNLGVSDVLGAFKVELQDPLGGLDLSPEGWLKDLNLGVSDVLGAFKVELRDPLGGLDLSPEGWLKDLNLGVSDVLGAFKVELQDPLGGLDLSPEGWLKDLNLGVSDVLGAFKVELRDPLGGLDLSPEGWLKDLNLGVSDVLGAFKVELRDPLGGLDLSPEGWLKDLNLGVSDVLGAFKVELQDPLGGLRLSPTVFRAPETGCLVLDRLGGPRPKPDGTTDTHQHSRVIGHFDYMITDSGLREFTRGLFADGHYSMAVLKAFMYVNNIVKVRSGLSDVDGVKLIQKALSWESPLIKLNKGKTDSDRNEQIGYKEILVGAMRGIRNPRAHEHALVDGPGEALELLGMAHNLLRKINNPT